MNLIYKNLINEIVPKLGDEYKVNMDHGYRHSLDLFHHAELLCSLIKEKNIDREVLGMAILLHDIFAKNSEYHGKQACEYFVNNFTKLFTKLQCEKISEAILNHDKKELEFKEIRKNQCIESKILYDIDNIDAFGLKGVYKYIKIYFERGLNLKQIIEKVPKNIENRYKTLTFIESKILCKAEYKIIKDFFDRLRDEYENDIIDKTQYIVFLIKENIKINPQEIYDLNVKDMKIENLEFAIEYFKKLKKIYNTIKS